MPSKYHQLNKIIAIAAAAFALFVALAVFIPTNDLVILLNGVFIGTMSAIAVAYWRLLWGSVMGARPYDRVRQMTIGFALCWLAYAMGVAVSIYYRTSGMDVNSSIMISASRYVAVIAAVLQVTAPDFGMGLFHGRDRKVLITGGIAGLVVAAGTIMLQSAHALA